MTTKHSKVEIIKAQSHYLRGDLARQLEQPTSHFDEEALQLLKFSGMYQQDDRDQRKARRQQGQEKAYSFMIRSKLPGGTLTAAQYLVHDELADAHGNGTLRFTTRQGIQLHGVLKRDLRPALRTLDRALVTTLGACGDVVRNVTACPAPDHDGVHALVQHTARQISHHFLPRSESYYDLWLDGERITREQARYTPTVDAVEPLYGRTYLPRKFKIGVACPQDNCIDVFTQDVGVIPVLDGRSLRGFNLLVGGGMGMSHTDDGSFPRLAEPLGFVATEDLLEALEVIVTLQRDYGNRENRKRARMKYLLKEWGSDRFRQEFTRRFHGPLGAWEAREPFRMNDHLGWHAQGDGCVYLGLPIEHGRIKDEGQMRLKTGLREIAQRFMPTFRITTQQNLLLCDLPAERQDDVRAVLQQYGIRTTNDISRARRHSLACPALPTCGLALAESERAMPQIIDGIEDELSRLGLAGEDIAIRMTGCPNGCARPYTAELAFVGRSLDLYNIYVGGSFNGTRLAQAYAELVRRHDLVTTIKPLLRAWSRERKPGEAFGDYCHRAGIDKLKAHAELDRV